MNFSTTNKILNKKPILLSTKLRLCDRLGGLSSSMVTQPGPKPG